MATGALPAKNKPLSQPTPVEAVLAILTRFWPIIFLMLMIIFFSVLKPAFFSVFNFTNMLVTSTLVALMAIGQTYVIITAGIDLSIGWTVGLASVIAARLMRDLGNGGMDPTLAILIGVAGGLAVSLLPGLINGLLVTKIKVPPFIATLGMLGVVEGIAFLLTDGQNVINNLPSNMTDLLTNIGNGGLLYYTPNHGLTFFSPPDGLVGPELRTVTDLVPYPVLITLAVVIVFGYILARTQFGHHTYAIGGNPEAARRAGINIDRHLILIYVLSGLTAGIAGVLHVFQYTAGAPNAGDAALLSSVAAVVVGGTSLFGGEGTLRGSIIGAIIFAVLQTGLVFLTVPSLWQFVVVGVIIIVAVLVNRAQSYLEKQNANRLLAHEEED